MKTMKLTIAALAFAAAACSVQSRTVSANYTLTQDEDWTADGTVKIENSATIDLNGHNLTVAGVSAYCITNEEGVVAGYSDLEYLDTSGNQRIYTNFKPESNDVVEAGVMFHQGSSASQFIWCARRNMSAPMETFSCARVSRKFRFDRNESVRGANSFTAQDGQRYDIVADYSTGVCTVNGGSAGTMNDLDPFVPPTNLVLFVSYVIGSNGALTSFSNYADLRFYYLRVTRGGSLVAHFVPVLRQGDGVVGIYDRIAGRFYKNVVTGAFSAGDGTVTNSGTPAELRLDVAAPRYEELDYIQPSGSEYIVTDCMPESTDRVEMKFNFATTNANQCLFCTREGAKVNTFMTVILPPSGKTDRYFRFDYNTTQKNNTSKKVLPDTDYEVVANGSTGKLNVNGTDYASIPPSAFTPPGPFVLFASTKYTSAGEMDVSSLGNYAKGRCYYFRIYDKDGDLKCDMVPARSSEGVYGMYDRVLGKFYPSASSSQFTLYGAVKGAIDCYANDTVSLTGNLKLVKKGEGTYVATMSGQSYNGGTEIQDGVLRCITHGTANSLGADGNEITVSANGVIDLNGMYNFGNYSFILSGGTINNSVDKTGMYNVNGIQSLALTADSTIDLDGRHTLGKTATLDLAGNKLTILTTAAIYFRGIEAVSAGTIELHGPRLIEFAYKDTADTNDLRLVDLVVTDGGQLRVQANVVAKLGDYVSAADAQDNNASYSGKIELYGTFRPDTDYFHGLEIQNGATIDISGRTTPLPCQSLIGENCVANTKNMTFADNATVRVNWGERDIAVRLPLISWTAETMPANLDTLRFIGECSRGTVGLIKKSDGLYQPNGLLISIR